MQVVKTVGEYKVIKKRSGRYGVLAKGRKWISGDDKLRVLDEAGLIQVPAPKPANEPAEAVAEEAAPEAEAAAEGDTGDAEEKAE